MRSVDLLISFASNVFSRAICAAFGHRWHNTVVLADGSRRKICAFCPATRKIRSLKRLED